jgi:predicted nucleic acid-binding protein
MTAKYFVDTNILLYCVDEGAGAKRDRARSIMDDNAQGPQKVISTQILQEFYAASVRKLNFTPTRARELTLLWSNLEVVRIETEDVLTAIDCSILNQLSFWDALIVTAARKAACSTLWTEDLNHGQIIQGVRIENPFLKSSTSGPSMVRESSAKRRPRRGVRDELYRV